MVKRTLTILLAAALAYGAPACKKPTPALVMAKKKKEFQDAQRLKAIKTYDEIATKFPNSPNAAQAAEHAQKLRVIAGPQKATPAKK